MTAKHTKARAEELPINADETPTPADVAEAKKVNEEAAKEEESAPADLPQDDTKCGSKLNEINAFYRDDIACVLEPGHSGPHSDGVNGQWPNTAPNTAVFDPLHLCPVCYPSGWPAQEYGASASCPHGSWTYPISDSQ